MLVVIKNMYTEVVVSKGLNNLRDKEEGQVNRMLLQDSVGVLENQWLAIKSWFEKRVCNDRWSGCPEKKMLQ